MGLCCFPAYRFQILCCYSDAELFVFFHPSSIRKSGHGLLPDLRHLAGSRDTGDEPNAMLAPPEREDLSRRGGVSLRWAGVLCLCFLVLPARRRNVGLYGTPARTLAACSESRTQRRHAPHVALQAFDTPAGSIGSIFSTVGISAPSTLFRQISRSPLLFRKDTKMPFFLRASTLFRI